MNASQRRQLERLVSALCEGVIDAQQREQLEQMLRESVECREFYLQYVDMHARLTAHPNLMTGIVAGAEATPQEDEMVLALAGESLGRFSVAADSAKRRRKTAVILRCLSLTLAVAACVAGVRYFLDWREIQAAPIVQALSGEAMIEGRVGRRRAAEIGSRLLRGERLQTADDEARVVLAYADGTRAVVFHDSAVEVPLSESDVQLRLVSGAMEVDAARQPPGSPLVFATDHARVVVLGTRFRLYRETHASRLELGEGKVRLERRVDGKAVEVSAGFVAVATSEPTLLDVQPLAAGTAELRATIRKAGESVAFSPKGEFFATGDWQRGLRTWTPGESEPDHSYEARIGRGSGLAFAGERLVHVNDDGRRGAATLWRPGDADAATIPLSGDHTRSRALSSDGIHVAESDNDGTRVCRIDLETARQNTVAELPDKGKAWCLSLSRSAEFAAAGFWDGTVRVYDLSTAAADRDSPSGTNEGTSLGSVVFEHRLIHTPTRIALSEDGGQLAVFSRKDGLLLFDLVTGGHRAIWASGAADVRCLKFISEGRRVLAGLGDGTARIWSSRDGRSLLVIDAGHSPHDVAWSEERSLLATAGGAVKLWECRIAPGIESVGKVRGARALKKDPVIESRP